MVAQHANGQGGPVSIRRLLLLLVIAMWMPAVLGIALMARGTYLREVQDSRTGLQRRAEAINSLVERELDRRVVVARTLGASNALARGDLQQFRREALAATAGSGDWVLVVDREQQLLNTRAPMDSGARLKRAPGSPFVTQTPQVFFTTSGPLLKRPVIAAFAAPPGATTPDYNVGVAFDPAVLQQIVEREHGAEAAVASVVNSEQRVIARSVDAARFIGVQATGPVLDRLQRGDGGFLQSVTLDGTPSTTYVSPRNRHGWSTAVALPDRALLASARRLTLQALLSSGVLLVVGFCAALATARRIERPVRQLSQAAGELGANRVPPLLSTGVVEGDRIAQALHEAGLRSEAATRQLEERVALAVDQAKAAHSQLLEAQKHEAIGRLTGGIAHDFNNLLQTILTGLQVLDRQASGEVQKKVLQSVLRATSKAADVVRQMLAFGRTQALQPRAVDVRDFLLQTRELTAKALGAKVRLSADVQPGLPPVFVDPSQLELALLNLVFNARDAMPAAGGKIAVSARPASEQETGTLPPGRYVCIEVADDGPGMTAEVLGRAFDPYFTTKPVGKGSGLGLAQVKFFCRQSGGEALLHSVPGQGTRVCMVLPATDVLALAEPADAAPANDAASRPLRVLMVEDDVLVASVVVPALEQEGHAVALCSTGDEALERLAAGLQAEVLFTDVVMPGSVGGAELVALCRHRHPQLAAVIATGYSEQPLSIDAQVLRKPYRMDQLLQALQQAAGHAQPPQPAAVGPVDA
jgi:signal transduction histidine kinase/ActR/RegA family two-component response regulator